MASTQSTVAYIYKTRYHGEKPADLAMRDHVLQKMLSKKDGMGGKSGKYTYAARYGNPQSIAGEFTDALTQAGDTTVGGSKGVQFEATRRKIFGIIQLDGESLAAAEMEGDDAFLDLVTQESDGVLEEHGDVLSHQLYRGGNGNLGQRSSISTNKVTLANKDQARYFKVGMTVIASANANGSSPRSGSTTVAAVDEDAGTVDLTAAASIVSFADDDYLFRQGTTGAGGHVVDGLAALNPLVAPVFGSDSFRGVDRGAHVRLLAGSRLDDTTVPVEEAIGRVAVQIAQSSKRALRGSGVVLLNPIQFWRVTRRTDAKITYDGGGNKATVGFEGINIATPAGTMRCVSDPDCPIDRAHIVALEALQWKTLRKWVHVVSDDKQGPHMRVYNADSLELRCRSMGNVLATDLGALGTCSLSAS